MCFGLTSCRQAPNDFSEPKDLATDFYDSPQPGIAFLFYREGDKVIAVRCAPGTVTFDRSVCTLYRREVDATWFMQQLSRGVGERLPKLEKEERDIYARITDVDRRLIEIVSSDVDQSLIDALAQRQVDLNTRIVEIENITRQLDGQIVALEAAIAATPTADLISQLSIVKSQRAETLRRCDTVKAELTAVRSLYVTTHGGTLSDHNYTNLLARRDELIALLTRARSKVEKQLSRLVALQNVIAMLNDGNFVSEVIRASNTYQFEKEFAQRAFFLFGSDPWNLVICEGEQIPEDYPDFASAMAAMQYTGGTICVGAGNFSQPDSPPPPYLVLNTPDLYFDISGMGMNKTTLPPLGVYLYQCSNCSIRIRDLTVGGKTNFVDRQSSSRASLTFSRVKFQKNLHLQMESAWKSVTIDQSRLIQGANVSCNNYHHTAASSTAVLNISNSLASGNEVTFDMSSDTRQSSPGLYLSMGGSSGSGVLCPGLTANIVNNTFFYSSVGAAFEPGVTGTMVNNLFFENKIGLNDSHTLTQVNNAFSKNTADFVGTSIAGSGHLSRADLAVALNYFGTDFSSLVPMLNSNSPLRGAGVANPAADHDFGGRPRGSQVDIGAIQYDP